MYWITLSVLIVCATVLYWSKTYLAPYKPATPVEHLKEPDDRDLKDVVSFDNIIAEIYQRLDEE